MTSGITWRVYALIDSHSVGYSQVVREKPNGGGNMTEEKKPVKKVKCGRISISLWKKKATSGDGRAYEQERACVQHSRKNYQTGEWQNQHIWLNIDELRDLTDALDQLNEVGESPSSLLDIQKQPDAEDLYISNDSLSMR